MKTPYVARLLAGIAVFAMGGRVAAADCSGPEHRRLDFWLGDWETYDADDRGKVVARTRVDAVLAGCALRERYEGVDGLVGESLTTYDAARKLWHQNWVTNRGQLLSIEGRFERDRLTLQGSQLSADGRASLVRGVWAPEAGGVRETAHTSNDAGATWRPLFDVFFRRREAERVATETLTRLNREYVDAFMKADASWYRDNLADDFVCIESDGTVVERDEFLRAAARGPDVASYELVDVGVRLFGDVALVRATGRFARRDGTGGASRYTDVYVLRDGRWKAVSAQITRSRAPDR